MDLLFKRYASPFSLLDGYIQTNRFTKFIRELYKVKAEEDRWEFYIHRVWNQSYQDYCDALENAHSHQNMSDDAVGATIQQSMNILNSFSPPMNEGE